MTEIQCYKIVHNITKSKLFYRIHNIIKYYDHMCSEHISGHVLQMISNKEIEILHIVLVEMMRRYVVWKYVIARNLKIK